jgi:hypothetical protein
VDRFTARDGLFLAAKRRTNLAFHHDKGLFEIVAMRRRSAADRNKHVDETETAFRIIAGKHDRIRIANQPNVRKVGVSFGSHEPGCPRRIVRWNRQLGFFLEIGSGIVIDGFGKTASSLRRWTTTAKRELSPHLGLCRPEMNLVPENISNSQCLYSECF